MPLPPASVILSFPTPNYVNPVTRGPSLLVVNGVLIGVAVSAVIVRLWSRLRTSRTLGWDDIFCALALIFAIGLGVLETLANEKFLWNRHIYDIPPENFHVLGLTALAAKYLFCVAATFVRLSILCFYYRLVRDTGETRFRIVVHFGMVLNLSIFTSFMMTSFFICRPLKDNWTAASAECPGNGYATVVFGAINSFADLVTTLMPIPMVIAMNMRLQQKIGVVFLMSLGLVVTVAGVFRTYYSWKSLLWSYDETWYSYPLWIAAGIEINLAIIICCVPRLRPVFGPYLAAMFRPITYLWRKSSGSQRSTPRPESYPSSFRRRESSNSHPYWDPEMEANEKYYDYDDDAVSERSFQKEHNVPYQHSMTAFVDEGARHEKKQDRRRSASVPASRDTRIPSMPPQSPFEAFANYSPFQPVNPAHQQRRTSHTRETDALAAAAYASRPRNYSRPQLTDLPPPSNPPSHALPELPKQVRRSWSNAEKEGWSWI